MSKEYLEDDPNIIHQLNEEYQKQVSRILNAPDLDDNTKFYLISTLQMKMN